jgi:hypothetical protein
MYREIPNSNWRVTDFNESVSADGMTPNWLVVLTGHASGRYDVLWRSFDGRAGTSVTASGTTRPGLVEAFELRKLLVIAAFDELIAAADTGPGKSLAQKLRAARAKFAEDANGVACAQLSAFSEEVRAQAGKKVSAETVQKLLEGAAGVRVLLGCR